jgi:hypothetical protein
VNLIPSIGLEMYSYEHNSMNEVWNKISIIYMGLFCLQKWD